MKLNKRILWGISDDLFWSELSNSQIHIILWSPVGVQGAKILIHISYEVFNSIKKSAKQGEEKAYTSLCAVFVIHKLTFILAISEVIRSINGLMKGWNFFPHTENVTCYDKRNSLSCLLWYGLRIGKCFQSTQFFFFPFSLSFLLINEISVDKTSVFMYTSTLFGPCYRK